MVRHGEWCGEGGLLCVVLAALLVGIAGPAVAQEETPAPARERTRVPAADDTRAPAQDVTRYVRYEHDGVVSHGILRDGVVHQLAGDLFDMPRPTGTRVPRDQVRLLAPVRPSKVIAVGLNYRSHLGDREPAAYPGLFAKYPTSIVGPGADIVMPPDATELHYEGELVVVMGREARNVSVEAAPDYVFGVTAGNDVSERAWQREDLQWLRAKGSDTFGPIGPVIATGLDYDDLLLQTRVNGELRQSESTRDLIFDVPTIVSYISHYITLRPGDVIFTGTPGSTRALQPGDVVEVEVEGVGILRNRVTRGMRRGARGEGRGVNHEG